VSKRSHKRATCRVCGRGRAEVGELSWVGYCIECGIATRNRANDEMHYHSGEYFELWRRRMAACVGGALIEDLTP
jgi:hypothetical protein